MEGNLPDEDGENGLPVSDQDPGFDILDLFGILNHHRDATALFIVPDSTPTVQMDDELIPVGTMKLSAAQCTILIERILDDSLKSRLQADGRVKFEHAFDSRSFYVDCFVKDGNLSASINPWAQL
ncbi:MAG: hypothetical protein AB9903_26465 [Vulcanimicrobiota bacterium]